MLDAFLRGLGRALSLSTDARERLEAAVIDRVAHGRAAHDAFEVDEADVATLLGEITHVEDETIDVDALIAALESIPSDDVVLALACARGDERALMRFRDLYLESVPGVARRVGNASVDVGDVVSRVNEALFVAPPGGRARILDMVGRGSLGGLVRVIAVRTAINLGRSTARELADPHEALANAIASQTDPELAAIKERHRSAMKTALEAAIASLPADERNLLRLSLLHRLTVDEIASLQRVHRSTAARRLAKIREQLGKEARRRLRVDLGAGNGDLAQVYDLVSSSLHVSFERLLGA